MPTLNMSNAEIASCAMVLLFHGMRPIPGFHKGLSGGGSQRTASRVMSKIRIEFAGIEPTAEEP